MKIIDYATTPLRKIKNALFSIKSLVLAITAGMAAKQFVLNPINLADQYSSAKIGFQTLLGEQRGQQMMDDLDAFAKATPFKTSGVIANTQKMLAMGWDAENIISDMKVIGDAAAATGKMDEGLQRIVLALSQIKSKGKLSTEELNQLAEAGISAKRYLAEGLGYGSGDSGIAKLSKDLEGGKIGAEKAIAAIVAGMKEYEGMMDRTANETVEGLKSQLEDTFEINIFRRWGQGLQDGAKKGLGSVVSMLDTADKGLAKFGDTLYDLGSTISNYLANKLEYAVALINEVTGSDAFKNATLGGKFKILWDELISTPFSNWWNTKGQKKFSEVSGKIGKSIGTGITKGLLALFGASDSIIDGTEAGASVAGSFCKGFRDGFDGSAITSAFVDAISNVWDALPFWAKLLIGGKVASSVVGGVTTLVGGAKNLIGYGSLLLGSTGNAMVSGSGIAGGLASLGYTATGGAASAAGYFGAAGMSGTAAAMTGLGVATGLGTGLFTAGHGIYDIYRGYKTDDTARKKAGAWQLGGAAGGALTGAAIGTAFGGPLIGTAIGALVGSGIGWWQSNKIKKQAEENAAAIDGMSKAEKTAAQEAAELKLRMQKLAQEDMAEHFGNITLSADEVKSVVNSMFGDDLIKRASAASGAIDQMASSYNSFTAQNEQLKKDLWLTTIQKDAKLSKSEISGLKSSTKNFSTAAQTFLKDAQYSSSESIIALMGNSAEAQKVIDASTNYYDKQRTRITRLTSRLNSEMTKALSDGVISVNEEKSIQKIRAQISNILAEIRKSEYEADLNIIKAKYSDSDISVDTFGDMMTQLETTANEMAEGFWQQFGEGSKGLKEGSEEWNALLKSTLDNLSETWQTAGDFGMDKLQTKWKDELGILGQDLSKIMQDHTLPEIKAAAGNVSDETKASIASMLEKMEPTTEQIQGIVDKYKQLGIEAPKALTDYLDTVEFYEALSKGPEAIQEFFNKDIDVDPKIKMVNPEITNMDELEKVFDIDANVTTEWHYDKFDKEWISPDGNYSFKTQALVDAGWTYDRFQGIWISPDGKYSFRTDADVGVNYTSDKFNSKMIAPQSSYRFNTTANVHVNYKISGTMTKTGIKGSLEKMAPELIQDGFVGSARGSIIYPTGYNAPGYASGGIVRGGARLVRVAEEGSPEMIIPLSSQRRERGMKLWEKAGHMLGAEGFSRGGLTTGGSDEGIRFNRYTNDSVQKDQSVQVDVGGIQVDIQVNAAQTNGDIVAAIKSKKGEIAEEIAGVLAEALSAQFENTPTRGSVA